LPLRVGLVASTGAFTVGGFLLLRFEAANSLEDSAVTVSMGIGGWLGLAASVAAAVAIGFALVRQSRLRLA
jgi:hypothetical protein